MKGVYWDKEKQKWRARIKIDGLRVHLGYFDSLEEAREYRVKKANEAFGNFTHQCEKQ